MDITELHQKMLYPMVRVRSEKSGGSGTIVYSKEHPEKKGTHETYLITNFHVVEAAVEQKSQWSPLLQRDVKKDVIADVTIEQFYFEYESWEPTTRGYVGRVVIYDKVMDLALVKIKTTKPFKHVATMFPRNEEHKRLRKFSKVVTVGCGMGHPPLQTRGELAAFDDIIDHYPYWLSTAPSIFGNSGGATFLAETAEYIGIPSRITVASLGFAADAITHMGFLIPITSVYSFLEDNLCQFIYDSEYTSVQCAKLRKEKRERDERQMAVETSRDEAGK